MELKVDIRFSILLSKINGTKRFFLDHNKYGFDVGWNIIPKHFGVVFGIVKPAGEDA